MTNTINIPHGIPNLHTAGELFKYLQSSEEPLSFEMHVYDDEAKWLEGRRGRIGASQVGTVLGLTDQWKTRLQLFDEMTGKSVDEFKGNEYTQRGQSEEPLIRALWAIEHPDWDVYDGTHLLMVSKLEPWRSCSLDMVCVRRLTGERVIGEIKTGVWNKKWTGGGVPDGYLAQVSQQLDITKFDGAVIVARLQSASGMEEPDTTSGERAYYFSADDAAVQDNMRYVRREVADFWNCVQRREYRAKINIAL